jgi:hypothetical protein
MFVTQPVTLVTLRDAGAKKERHAQKAHGFGQNQGIGGARDARDAVFFSLG